mgnify:FL=1
MITTRLGHQVPRWHLACLGFSQVLSGWSHIHNWAVSSHSSRLSGSARITVSDVISGWGMSDTLHDVLNRKRRTDHRYRSGQDVPALGASKASRFLSPSGVCQSCSKDRQIPRFSRCISELFLKFNYLVTGSRRFRRLSIRALSTRRSACGGGNEMLSVPDFLAGGHMRWIC